MNRSGLLQISCNLNTTDYYLVLVLTLIMTSAITTIPIGGCAAVGNGSYTVSTHTHIHNQPSYGHHYKSPYLAGMHPELTNGGFRWSEVYCPHAPS